MAEKGAPALLQHDPARGAPTPTDLLDPIALERRLSEARARRAAALAGKERAGPRAPVPGSAEAPARAPAEAASALPQPDTAQRPSRRIARLFGLFLAGLFLGGGAAFVLAPAPMRNRIVDLAAFQRVPGLLASRIAPAPVPGVDASAPSSPHMPVGPPPVTELALRPRVPEPTAPAQLHAPAPEIAPASAAAPDGVWAATSVADLQPPASTPPAAAVAPLGGAPVIADVTHSIGSVAIGLVVPGPEPDVSEIAAVMTVPALVPISLPPVRVLLHVSPTARNGAENAIAALEAAGAAEVVAVPVSFEVSRTDVRFFHGTDRAAADEVASVLARRTDGALPQARDFTHFSPRPVSGDLEVWLAGAGR